MRIDASFGLGESQTVMIVCVFLIVVMDSQRPEIDKKVSAGTSDIHTYGSLRFIDSLSHSLSLSQTLDL